MFKRIQARRFQPPLHLAVINDDFAAMSLLRNNPELMARKNWQGFSALELAKLLGKDRAVRELAPKIPKPILVQAKGQSDIAYCNRAQFEELFGVHYLETLTCSNIDMLEEVCANVPWLLAHTVAGQEHRSLGSQLRHKLFDGYLAETFVKWIDEEIGYGLFAKEPLSKESFIGQYSGIVRKIGRFSPLLNGYCMHLPTRFCSFQYYLLDAEQAGNETRFANHSDQPNMRPLCLIDRSLMHIGLFAKRDIQAGEELTFNYGRDYWKSRKKIAR